MFLSSIFIKYIYLIYLNTFGQKKTSFPQNLFKQVAWKIEKMWYILK